MRDLGPPVASCYIAAVAATTALMTAVMAGVPAINDSCGDYSSCSGDLGRPGEGLARVVGEEAVDFVDAVRAGVAAPVKVSRKLRRRYCQLKKP